MNAVQGFHVQVVIDDSRIPEALALMPLDTAVEIRNAFGRMFGKWYATHVASVGPRMQNLAKRVRYNVAPKNLTKKERATLPAAKLQETGYARTRTYLEGIIREGGNALAKISGAIISRSRVVGIQERGGTVRPAKGEFMTVPINWPRSPIGGDYRDKRQTYEFKDRFPIIRVGRTLFFRIGTGLVPAFALKESVTIKPGLRIMATWNALEGYRSQVLREGIDAVFRKFYRTARRTIGKAASLGARLAG